MAVPQFPMGDILPDLTKRYKELGGKYVTDKIHEGTGLPINSCMERDNLQECYEEMVDAIFNILVYIYRYPDRDGRSLLTHLLVCIRALRMEGQHLGTYLHG